MSVVGSWKKEAIANSEEASKPAQASKHARLSKLFKHACSQAYAVPWGCRVRMPWPMADDVARGGVGSLRAPC
eukprot:2871579-Prymnesium_polylepis.1